MTYPPDWPRCACGDPVLDGHLTCGRWPCNEAEARDRARLTPWMVGALAAIRSAVAPESYTCEACGGTFTEAWSDAEAHAEAVKNFGRRGDAPGMARVCDDCFRAVMEWAKGRN